MWSIIDKANSVSVVRPLPITLSPTRTQWIILFISDQDGERGSRFTLHLKQPKQKIGKI